MIILFEFRGVFQSLIEKHFPAPDTQKTLDIFGLKDKQNSIFDDIDLNNILTRTREKRKGTVIFFTILHLCPGQEQKNWCSGALTYLL